MKKVMHAALLFLFMIQVGCMPQSRSSFDLSTAQDTLVSFFSLLAYHAYSQVSGLYGGGYDSLLSMNPDLTADDPGLIWQRACEVNGFQCLEIKQVLSAETVGVDEYHFIVQFMNQDGSLFVLNPDGGADATSVSPQSEFEYIVKRDEGRFTVRTLPVYMP
jgi:hypothetical protein